MARKKDPSPALRGPVDLEVADPTLRSGDLRRGGEIGAVVRMAGRSPPMSTPVYLPMTPLFIGAEQSAQFARGTFYLH